MQKVIKIFVLYCKMSLSLQKKITKYAHIVLIGLHNATQTQDWHDKQKLKKDY